MSRDIEYEKVERTRGSEVMRVYLNGRYTGAIKTVSGGFSYFPKGQKRGGEVFKSVADVQRSLEPEDSTND